MKRKSPFTGMEYVAGEGSDMHYGYDGLSRGWHAAEPDWVNPECSGTKLKSEHPYSYSPFFLFRAKPKEQLNNAMYHDRMQMWDQKKYADACEAIGGERAIHQLNRTTATEFLKTYLGKDVVCTALAEGCNIGNGYPYWIFWYDEAK